MVVSNCFELDRTPPDSGARQYKSRTWKGRFDPALRACGTQMDLEKRFLNCRNKKRQHLTVHAQQDPTQCANYRAQCQIELEKKVQIFFFDCLDLIHKSPDPGERQYKSRV